MMATIFALSLVPAGALAAPVTGDIEVGVPVAGSVDALNKGSITLENTKKNETYEAYRIFDLASFNDKDVATGHHLKDEEAYSYVINDETVKYSDLTHGGTNPWLTFLLNYGPNGIVEDGVDEGNDITTADYTVDNFPYAMYSDDFETFKSGNPDVAAKVYFVIERGTVTLNLPNPGYNASASGDGNDTKESLPVSGYHVVRANEGGPFAQKNLNDDDDSKTSVDYMGGNTMRDDEDGNPVGQDFTAIMNKVVQDFAQEALKYATNNHGVTHAIINPNYVETGVGPTAADPEANPSVVYDPGRVTVNGDATGDGSGQTPSWSLEKYGSDYDGTGKVPLGWYLVGTSMGTLASLDTTNKDVTVYEKNDEPTIEKAVMKKGAVIPDTKAGGNPTAAGVMSTEDLFNYLTTDNSTMWVEDTAADVNDDVMFRTVVTAQQGAKDYVLHDAMERGLTLLTGTKSSTTHEYQDDSNVASYDPQVFVVRRTEVTPATGPVTYEYEVWYVPASGKNDDQAGTAAENYVFTYGNTLTDGCDFEIAFKDAVPEAQGKDDRVTFRALSVMNSDGSARRDYASADVMNEKGNYTDVDLKDGDQIVVLYWAKVNAKAAIWQGERDVDGTKEAGSANVNAPLDDEDIAGGKHLAKVETNADAADAAAHPDTHTTNPIEGNPKRYADGNGRNENHTVLTYGANGRTKWERAQVTTYGFDLTKTKEVGKDGVSQNDEYPLLDGATFSVRKAMSRADLEVKVKKELTTEQKPNPTDTEVGTEITNRLNNKTYVEVKVQTGANAFVQYYYEVAGGKLFFEEVAGDDLKVEPNAMALTGASETMGADGTYVGAHRFYRYLGDGVSAGGTTDIKPTDKKSAHLYGLDNGIYVLTEEKAPTGYNKLAHPIVVTVTGDKDTDGLVPGDPTYNKSAADQSEYTDSQSSLEDYDKDEGLISVLFWTNDNVYKPADSVEGYNKAGASWMSTIETSKVQSNDTVVYDTDLDDSDNDHTKKPNGGVQVVNQTGAELPSTGGIGTTIFYVAGTVLVVGAVVMLVAKRRMSSEA